MSRLQYFKIKRRMEEMKAVDSDGVCDGRQWMKRIEQKRMGDRDNDGESKALTENDMNGGIALCQTSLNGPQFLCRKEGLSKYDRDFNGPVSAMGNKDEHQTTPHERQRHRHEQSVAEPALVRKASTSFFNNDSSTLSSHDKDWPTSSTGNSLSTAVGKLCAGPTEGRNHGNIVDMMSAKHTFASNFSSLRLQAKEQTPVVKGQGLSYKQEDVTNDLKTLVVGKDPATTNDNQEGLGEAKALPLRKRRVQMIVNHDSEEEYASAPLELDRRKHLRPRKAEKKVRKRKVVNNASRNFPKPDITSSKQKDTGESVGKVTSSPSPKIVVTRCADMKDKHGLLHGRWNNTDLSRDSEETRYSAIVGEVGDAANLSSYQCEIRKHLELFEASYTDVRTSKSPGRKGQIRLGQVGIRCRWCAHVAPRDRARGGANYSHTIEGMYQCAQNMAREHLSKLCTHVPVDVKRRLVQLKDPNSRAKAGKAYWAKSIEDRGIREVLVEEDRTILMLVHTGKSDHGNRKSERGFVNWNGT